MIEKGFPPSVVNLPPLGIAHKAHTFVSHSRADLTLKREIVIEIPDPVQSILHEDWTRIVQKQQVRE